jgi:hypothetical protein
MNLTIQVYLRTTYASYPLEARDNLERMVPQSNSKSAKISRKAFEDTMSVLGKSGVEVIVSDLISSNSYGEDLDEEALAECLTRFFGDAGGGLLLLRTKIRNRELLKLAEA